MRVIFFAFLSLTCLCFVSLAAFADEGERGRLPDGRAFRVDQEGNQLVDYIAELELEKEGLENRIFSLQDDLRAKNKDSAVTKAMPVVACPACAQPVCEQHKCEEKICEPRVCPAIQPVSCPKVEMTRVTCPTCVNRDGEISTLEEKVKAIANDNKERGVLVDSLEEELSGCRDNVKDFERTSAHFEESIAELRKVLGERDSSLQLARNQVSELRQQQQQLIAKQVMMESSEQAHANAAASSATRASLGTSNSLSNSALSAGRQQLLARLSELASQVRARDEQFARIDQHGKPLQVRPSALVTRSGFEMRTAQKAISEAPNFRRLSEISRELDALSRLVADDIRLGSRLAKSR